MTELQISKIEKQDIKVPVIEPGGTAIVFQRHERYERDHTSDRAGSIFPEHAEAAKERDLAFFRDLLAKEEPGQETMFFFVSSDTQYDSGRRSLETGQLAQDAAIEAMTELGIDPNSRILNLSDDFITKDFKETNQRIRPMVGLREPQIFNQPEYIAHLKNKYGEEDGPGTGLSQAAWGAHEADLEKEVREKHGAEGVHDILDRTKESLRVLRRYSRVFHKQNPNKKLVVWATSHYDTISPFVKEATNTDFSEYLPVDYGGGVIINISPNGEETILKAQGQEIALELGRVATDKS
jgi:hypothetical protein